MFQYYTPIFLLQAFCVYLAYRNNADYRWYWFILLFPGIGAAFYLFHHYYSRNSLNSITESVKEVVNSNYKIDQLEKAFRFSDNLKNRINLADAYVDFQRYDDAIKLYDDSLTGIMADDPGIRMKLLNAHYFHGNYPEAIELGKELEKEKSFRNSVNRLSYAWALHKANQTELAEKVFKDMDRPQTNFRQRLEYCKFLQETTKIDDLKSVLTELLEEFEHMHGPERKIHREVMREVRQLYSSHLERK